MTPARPLAPRQFVIVATALFSTVLTLLIILAPIDEWWAILAPRELAVYRLQTSREGMPFRGCLGHRAAEWQLLRGNENAAVLFDSVATSATTTIGRVLGLAGLRDVASPRFGVLRDSFLLYSDDSLVVYGEPASTRWVSLREVIDGGLLDSAIADLKGPVPRVEC